MSLYFCQCRLHESAQPVMTQNTGVPARRRASNHAGILWNITRRLEARKTELAAKVSFVVYVQLSLGSYFRWA